jgi:hypothetical protein
MSGITPEAEAPRERGPEMLREFAALAREKSTVKDRLDEIERRMTELQEPLKEHFVNGGMQNARVDGMTCYIRRQLWAKLKEGHDMDEAVAAMKGNGMGEFVREAFNVHTLSSHARELAREEKALPAEVLDYIDVSEVVTIQARRS